MPRLYDKKLRGLAQASAASGLMFKACLICFGLICLLALFEIFTGIPVPRFIFFVLIAVTFIGGFGSGRLGGRVRAMQKDVAVQLAPVALEREMDRLDAYERSEYVDEKYLTENMGYPEYKRLGITPGDYARGVLRGWPVEFCEFSLVNEEMGYDSDDEYRLVTNFVFKGLAVVCRHRLELGEDFTITQYGEVRGPKTGNEEFDSALHVGAVRGDDALRLLTPQYQRRLLELSAELGDVLGLGFHRDGTLVVVLRDWNLFENEDEESEEELVEKMRGEVRRLADVLERLEVVTA